MTNTDTASRLRNAATVLRTETTSPFGPELAAWLDEEAQVHDFYTRTDLPGPDSAHALAIADQILGTLAA